MHKTRKLHMGESDRLDELARASADLWNRICKWYWRWVDRQDHWTSKGQMQKWCVNGHNDFHTHTAQAVNDQFYDAIRSWHGDDRRGDPPKDRQKHWNKVCWKKQAIKLRDDGVLRLSCGRGNEPILIDWPVGEKPVFVEIGWNDGYEVRATYKVEPEDRTTGNRTAGVDLGEKHIAAVSTGEDCFLLNGGGLRSLRHQQNKTKACLQSKIDNKEPGSNRWKKLVRTKNKQLQKVDNQIDDLLHKLSRKLIEMLLERGVSTVVFGELGEITRSVSYGSQMNQRLSQWAHGKFAQMLEYKAKGAGIDVEYVDEAYTSQTCPRCGERHKPSGRNYSCPKCGLEAHRDAVGAENIRRKYVGRESARLPGAMASPSGVRFHPHLQCSSAPGDVRPSVAVSDEAEKDCSS